MYKQISLAHAFGQIFTFESNDNSSEFHLIIHATDSFASFESQLNAVAGVFDELKKNAIIPNEASPVMLRFFVSDAATQAESVKLFQEKYNCAVSIVEQAPLDGTKVALWIYAQTNVSVTPLPCGLYAVEHGGYCHLWGAGATDKSGDSYTQTLFLLNNYVKQLSTQNATLLDNCIRTWFFVQNIDVNYAGVVSARNDLFDKEGLTTDTHYISSTGIGGRSESKEEIVRMDTYAILGAKPEQVKFLHASTHMNPTHEYGVSFERATSLDFGDRRHVYISGTASINNHGEVVHIGDIRKQTERMWENVEVLLSEAECNFADVAHMIVYLRDISDYNVVKSMFDKRFPETPHVIVYAAVCRPGWLIEMECMAVKKINKSAFATF